MSNKKITTAIRKESLDDLKDIFANCEFDWTSAINRFGDTALHIAIRTGNIEIVTWMLNNIPMNYEVSNKDWKRPIHEAVLVEKEDLVSALINKDVDVNALKRGDWTPLMIAATKSNLKVVQTLLEANALLNLKNKDGWTAFHIACREGNITITQYLLSQDGNLWQNLSNNLRTPLHTAALCGETKMVQYLLEKGNYSPDGVDSCGNTPFMEALRSMNLDTVKLLVSNQSIDINKEDLLGRRPIHIAAEAGHVNAVIYLIDELKVDPNTITQSGSSSIHFAAKQNHTNVIKILLKFGIDINLADCYGRSALWMAASSRHKDCYEFLKTTGASNFADNNEIRPDAFFTE